VCTVLTSCAKINARAHKKVKLMHTGVMVGVGNGCKDGVWRSLEWDGYICDLRSVSGYILYSLCSTIKIHPSFSHAFCSPHHGRQPCGVTFVPT